MRIYQVVYYDNAFAYYFEPTKARAEAKRKELMASADPQDTCEIEEIDLELNRSDICRVLNNFVDIHCINEH